MKHVHNIMLSLLAILLANLTQAQTIQGTNVELGTGVGTNSYNEFSTLLGNYAGDVINALNNTFVGYRSGGSKTTGSSNVFIGLESGYGSGAGHSNTYLGNYAGKYSTGSANTFVGQAAGGNGSYNVSLGFEAGSHGSGNVNIGYRAGNGQSGNNQLFIDSRHSNPGNSTPLIHGNFVTNQLAIGEKVFSSTDYSLSAPGKIYARDFVKRYFIGNIGTGEMVPIDFASNLQQVKVVSLGGSEKARTEGVSELGFDPEQLMELFPGLIDPEIEGEYGVKILEMIPLLVLALQEANHDRATLQKEIALLQDKVTRLEGGATRSRFVEPESNTHQEQSSLQQNFPNPAGSVTTINLELAENVQQAQLLLTDLNGKVVKKEPLTTGKKRKRIDLSTNELPNGIYHYTLVTDGKPVATKRMVLSR